MSSMTDGMETLAAQFDLDEDAHDLAHRMVGILRELPGVRTLEDQQGLELAAWASISLRRGRISGRRVAIEDLEVAGLDQSQVQLAWLVGGHRRQDEEQSRQTMLLVSMAARVFWTAYWVARAEQSRDSRKRSTWKALASRAERETAAQLQEIPEPQGSWLEERLARARLPNPGSSSG